MAETDISVARTFFKMCVGAWFLGFFNVFFLWFFPPKIMLFYFRCQKFQKEFAHVKLGGLNREQQYHGAEQRALHFSQLSK